MKNFRILVVDDSKTFLLYIREMFRSYPQYEFTCLISANEALTMLEHQTFDLILSDYEMPDMSGPEFCKKIKSKSHLKIIPILMLTASTDDKALEKAISSGADDFLYKSSTKEVVEIKIKSLLRSKLNMDTEIQDKQLKAVKALIATSNHEFNNALFISNETLKKMKKINQLDQSKIQLIDKALEMNFRMHSVVKNLENISNIELLGDAKEIQTLKI